MNYPIRFSKYQRRTTPRDWPLTQAAIDAGLGDRWINPVPGKNHVLAAPPREGEPAFIHAVEELIRCREDVKAGRWPSEYLEARGLNPIPHSVLWEAGVDMSDPNTAAQLVRMDRPMDLWLAVADYLMSEGYTQLKDPPLHGHDFLTAHVTGPALFAANLHVAMKKAWDEKYYWGGVRPETCLGLGAAFTAYEEGCPPHPSYPAGHGTVAGTVYRVAHDVFDLRPDVSREVREITKHFALYRDFAGVHFHFDSMAGWALGASD